MTEKQTSDELLEILKESKKTHLSIAEKMLKADDNALYPLDLLAVGVFKRSISLIRGFTLLIENENFICAVPLIRLQMDNLLRFYASFIVKEPHKFATDIIDGKHIRNLKDSAGNKMTDRYLVDKMTQEIPWIKSVYEKTSGYIHLSSEHVFDSFKGSQDYNKRKLSIAITDRDEEVSEAIKIEAIKAMCHITQELLRYLYGWTWTKDNPKEMEKTMASG
ncbi:hypothetical protein [Flavobacterium sp.]|uniref:hypothetical protein n=1 Tax=Flavobacterium sp. TaxID=239 RepID=UPI004034F45F